MKIVKLALPVLVKNAKIAVFVLIATNVYFVHVVMDATYVQSAQIATIAEIANFVIIFLV